MTEAAPEDNIRRVRPPRAERVRPDLRPDTGWQSPPLPGSTPTYACPHIGSIGASLQAARYALGTEWICSCGQVFIVAINAGDKRTLMKVTKTPVEVVDFEPPIEEETVVETPPRKNPDKKSKRGE